MPGAGGLALAQQIEHHPRMRTPIGLLMLCLAGEVLAEPGGAPVQFEFTQLHSDRGWVACALYASEHDWMKRPLQKTTAPIKDGQATCVFAGLAPGTYAMAAFHDENQNAKLDTNFLGIPREGVCASNQARGVMGPPKWKNALFVYTGAPVKQQLHMRYL